MIEILNAEMDEFFSQIVRQKDGQQHQAKINELLNKLMLHFKDRLVFALPTTGPRLEFYGHASFGFLCKTYWQQSNADHLDRASRLYCWGQDLIRKAYIRWDKT